MTLKNMPLDGNDDLDDLINAVDEALKVIDSGLVDVTADTVAIARLRERVQKIKQKIGWEE